MNCFFRRNCPTMFLIVLLAFSCSHGSEKKSLGMKLKYPKGEIDYYYLGKAQEDSNLVSAKVRTRTRYLDFYFNGSEISSRFIWLDSFDLQGRQVLHRYFNDKGLILSRVYTYDDHGKQILEKEFPGPEASLPDTNSFTKNEYKYDQSGNVIEHKMTFNSRFFTSITHWQNTYDKYGNLLKYTEEEKEIKDGTVKSTNKKTCSINFSINGDEKIIEQLMSRSRDKQSAKFISEYDEDDFLLKEERYIAKDGGEFKIDRTMIFTKDKQGRPIKKELLGSSSNLFAQYEYAYSGDTVIEKYSRTDRKAEEIRKYIRNQKISETDGGKLKEIFIYNDKGLLVKQIKSPDGQAELTQAMQILSGVLSPRKISNADTLVYEYYK